MNPIPVPAPPRSAYNENRRVSDLLYNQLKHFQHVELKRGNLGIDPEIVRNIHTEGGAARYIAAITTSLRGKAPATAAPPIKLAVMAAPKPSKKLQADIAFSIAGAAGTSSPSRKGSAKKAAKEGTSVKGTAKSRKGEK